MIDIPEELKQKIDEGFTNQVIINKLWDATKNGIPLPKGHGKLIDVKELKQDIIAHKYSIDFCREHNIDQSIDIGMLNILLANADTIIEADNGNEE